MSSTLGDISSEERVSEKEMTHDLRITICISASTEHVMSNGRPTYAPLDLKLHISKTGDEIVPEDLGTRIRSYKHQIMTEASKIDTDALYKHTIREAETAFFKKDTLPSTTSLELQGEELLKRLLHPTGDVRSYNPGREQDSALQSFLRGRFDDIMQDILSKDQDIGWKVINGQKAWEEQKSKDDLNRRTLN